MAFTYFKHRFPHRQTSPNAEIVKVVIQPRPYLALQDALCALIAFVLARRTHGSFVVAIDDTDPDPLESPTSSAIFNSLSWLNLSPDESRDLGEYGPYDWSQRGDIYREAAMYLIDQGLAYPCFSSNQIAEDGANFFRQLTPHPCDHRGGDEEIARLASGEDNLLCLRIPADACVEFVDPVYGEQHFSLGGPKDLPLFTRDGSPMPYFAHVVDNHLMQVTTQVRRHSALELVPYEVLLCQALGWSMPKLLPIPAIYDSQSPMLFEEVCLTGLLTETYFPEVVVNYLTHLIWSHPENKIVFPQTDFVTHFAIRDDLPETLPLDHKLLNFIQERYTNA